MGRRINFYKNCTGKPIKELVFEHYADFRVWYLQRNQKSILEFDETWGSEELLAYFAQNTDFLNDFYTLDNRLLNELLVEFIWDYGGLSAPGASFFEGCGPDFNKWRYMESTDMVYETKDSEFIQLWSFLILGRTLKDSTKVDKYNGEETVGFLTGEEQKRLRELIFHHFGDVNDPANKYLSDPKLGLADPPTQGLRIVIYILEGISAEQVDLMTMID